MHIIPRAKYKRLQKRLKWVAIIGFWGSYILFISSFTGSHTVFPVTSIVLILVLITGSQFGAKVGILAGAFGLPVTVLSYSFLSVTENTNLIRLVISTIGYVLAGGIAGRLHDLYNQLKAELNDKDQEILLRKEVEQALRESEKNYRELFELESDAIFIIQNEDGAILEANGVACALYGYSHEELVNLKNTDMSAEPEQTREKTQSAVPTDQVVNIPLRRHRKKDGTVFPVEITARFIQWKGRSVHIAAIRDITERRKTEEELERLAITDSLTGLLNRRQFMKEANELFLRAQHHPYEMSIVMIDLDHFKNVNDQHGHATGDAALREVSRRLKESVRPTDVVGRYGGEEFAIILPRTDLNETRQIANRLCTAMSEKSVSVEDADIPITISMGIAGLTKNVASLDELLQRADQALYGAKEEGRNRWAEWQAE